MSCAPFSVPTEALILVGGLGTRLGELTKEIPKPMLPVRGKPFLEWTLLWLRGQGVRRFILAAAYKSQVIRDYFGSGEAWDVEIFYSDPNGRQLGTGGSIKEAEALIQGQDFFVLNGDVRFEIEIAQLSHFHRQRQARATLALAPMPAHEQQRYGRVETDAQGRVQAFLEKKAIAGLNGEFWINAGIYVFNRRVLSLMEPGKHYSLETDIFPRLTGDALWAVKFEKVAFLDIGTPADYERAKGF